MKALSLESLGSALSASPKSAPIAIGSPNSVGKEASRLIQQLAEPRAAGEPVKSAIERASQRSGIHYWRAFDIWYGKARRIDDAEIAALDAAIAKKNKLDIRNEVADLRVRLARLESVLAVSDAEFHRETIDVVGEQVRRLG